MQFYFFFTWKILDKNLINRNLKKKGELKYKTYLCIFDMY